MSPRRLCGAAFKPAIRTCEATAVPAEKLPYATMHLLDPGDELSLLSLIKLALETSEYTGHHNEPLVLLIFLPIFIGAVCNMVIQAEICPPAPVKAEAKFC
jgi:hypothetical protein